MKTSARNHFKGTVREVTKGPVSTEVTIEISQGVRVVAVIVEREITLSVEDLKRLPVQRMDDVRSVRDASGASHP